VDATRTDRGSRLGSYALLIALACLLVGASVALASAAAA
jgi:hypothetical protein